MPATILDPFHRVLAATINEEIASRAEALANGSASRVTEDVVSVAEKYAAAVSYIKALRNVLEMCQQIESEQNSLQPRNANVRVVER